MQKIRGYVITVMIMCFISIIVLLGLSVLTYIFKWQADAALIGITLVYIVSGFAGGRVRKRFSDETNIGKKLLEGLFLGTLFMFVLSILSVIIMRNEFDISSRFLMIWMLLAGSAALGRIL